MKKIIMLTVAALITACPVACVNDPTDSDATCVEQTVDTDVECVDATDVGTATGTAE